jgi:hypothetical protein
MKALNNDLDEGHKAHTMEAIKSLAFNVFGAGGGIYQCGMY